VLAQQIDLTGMEFQIFISASSNAPASKTNTSTDIFKRCQGYWICKANGQPRASICPHFTNRLPLLPVGMSIPFQWDTGRRGFRIVAISEVSTYNCTIIIHQYTVFFSNFWTPVPHSKSLDAFICLQFSFLKYFYMTTWWQTFWAGS